MKKALKIIMALCFMTVLLFVFLFLRGIWNDFKMNDDYSSVYADPAYQEELYIADVGVISQEVTCGYATIELLASWLGKDITEKKLLQQNEGKITTATWNGMQEELASNFSELAITKQSKVKNSEVLHEVYNSLEKGWPVPVQYSTVDNRNGGSESVLHFGLIVGMDVKKDEIIISNPYGYEEKLSLKEFCAATAFDNYKNMEFPIRMGILIDMFTKNTIYIINQPELL